MSFFFISSLSYGEVFNYLACLFQLVWPIKCQCCPHIETSQLICTANQSTGFYMRATMTLNGLTKVIKGSALSKLKIKTTTHGSIKLHISFTTVKATLVFPAGAW